MSSYSRTHARELALQVLFSVEVGHQEPQAALDHVWGGISDEARRFVRDLVEGTLEYGAASDEMIAPLLEGWTLERLPTVDRLVLRMGVFELQHQTQTPRPVVINEAVELAKRFSTEDSGRFVNGVLANIAGLRQSNGTP